MDEEWQPHRVAIGNLGRRGVSIASSTMQNERMLIRNSDTGEMMELCLASGLMKPLDGDGAAAAPASAEDSTPESSPEKGGRKRSSFTEGLAKMRLSRRVKETAGAARTTKDVGFETAKVRLDVALEKVKFLGGALREQERAARAYAAASAEVLARVKDLGANTPLEAATAAVDAAAFAARAEVETTLLPSFFSERLVTACHTWHESLGARAAEAFARRETARRELDHYRFRAARNPKIRFNARALKGTLPSGRRGTTRGAREPAGPYETAGSEFSTRRAERDF